MFLYLKITFTLSLYTFPFFFTSGFFFLYLEANRMAIPIRLSEEETPKQDSFIMKKNSYS